MKVTSICNELLNEAAQVGLPPDLDSSFSSNSDCDITVSQTDASLAYEEALEQLNDVDYNSKETCV